MSNHEQYRAELHEIIDAYFDNPARVEETCILLSFESRKGFNFIDGGSKYIVPGMSWRTTNGVDDLEDE